MSELSRFYNIVIKMIYHGNSQHPYAPVPRILRRIRGVCRDRWRIAGGKPARKAVKIGAGVGNTP